MKKTRICFLLFIFVNKFKVENVVTYKIKNMKSILQLVFRSFPSSDPIKATIS